MLPRKNLSKTSAGNAGRRCSRGPGTRCCFGAVFDDVWFGLGVQTDKIESWVCGEYPSSCLLERCIGEGFRVGASKVHAFLRY